VSKYSVSLMANEKMGGMKKKSNARVPKTAATMEARRSNRAAASTTPNRYTIARLVVANQKDMTAAMAVQPPVINVPAR
jgi:hypothetical protein